MCIATLLALLASACASRTTLPPPRLPLAATPADAIPAPGPPPADTPMRVAVTDRTLDNGTRVLVSPRPAEGLVTVLWLDEAAAGRDRRANATVTSMLGFAMQDATRIGDDVVPSYARRQGFDLGLGVSPQAMLAVATFAAGELPRYLDVLDAVIRRPALRDLPLRGEIARRLETVEGELATAEGILDDRLPGLLYAPADPRSAPLTLQRAELASLDPAMIAVRHAQILDPSACTLIVVGEVEPSAVLEQANRVFGAWPAHPSAATLVPEVLDESPVRGIGVVRPLLRPWIGVFERAPSIADPDHAAFLVLGQVLGGMFSARLNLFVRESETLSYGLGAAYQADAMSGELQLATAVDPARVGAFLQVLLEELSRVGGAGGGITDRELEIARVRARQTLRERLDTTNGLASVLAERVLADLPATHILEVLDRIEHLSAEDIHAAARRWIRPAQAPIGIVASEEILRGQVARAPLGHMTMIIPPPRVRR
ncbi:MAG: M16 family metallopeptidase [Sandaracinaceae bacterium]